MFIRTRRSPVQSSIARRSTCQKQPSDRTTNQWNHREHRLATSVIKRRAAGERGFCLDFGLGVDKCGRVEVLFRLLARHVSTCWKSNIIPFICCHNYENVDIIGNFKAFANQINEACWFGDGSGHALQCPVPIWTNKARSLGSLT